MLQYIDLFTAITLSGLVTSVCSCKQKKKLNFELWNFVHCTVIDMDRGKGFSDYGASPSPAAKDKQTFRHKRKRSCSPSPSPSRRQEKYDENIAPDMSADDSRNSPNLRIGAQVRNQSSVEVQVDRQKAFGHSNPDPRLSGISARISEGNGAKKRLLCDGSQETKDNRVDDMRTHGLVGSQQQASNPCIWENFGDGQGAAMAVDRRSTHGINSNVQGKRNDIHCDAENLYLTGLSVPCSPFPDGQSGEHATLSLVATKIRNAQIVDVAKKDIAAFLGDTGVGKTTTINFCCEAQMVEIPSGDKYDKTVRIDVCLDQRESFLRIGHGESMTKNIDFLASPAKKKADPAKRKQPSDEILFCSWFRFLLNKSFGFEASMLTEFSRQICRARVTTRQQTKL